MKSQFSIMKFAEIMQIQLDKYVLAKKFKVFFFFVC